MKFKKGDRVALRSRPKFAGTIRSIIYKYRSYKITWDKPERYLGDESWYDFDLIRPDGIERAVARL